MQLLNGIHLLLNEATSMNQNTSVELCYLFLNYSLMHFDLSYVSNEEMNFHRPITLCHKLIIKTMDPKPPSRRQTIDCIYMYIDSQLFTSVTSNKLIPL